MSRRRRFPISRRAAARRAVRIRLIAVLDRVGPYADGAAFVAVGICVITAAWLVLGILSPADAVTSFTAIVISAGAASMIQRVRRRQNRLVSLTLSYLATGDRQALDTMLASLIAFRLKPQHWNSLDVLFGAFNRVLGSGDWEMRRRIAEALPALGVLDPQRTLSLLRSLRTDWDPSRWKDDLRRRAVEALISQASSATGPLVVVLGDQSDQLLSELIAVREDDRVFTAMACVEACAFMHGYQPDQGVQIYQQSMAVARRRMEHDEVRALETVWEIWTDSDDQRAIDTIRAAMSHGARDAQIAAARAVYRFAERNPVSFLDVLEDASLQSRHHYVRRVVAREVNVSRLLQLASRGAHASRAEQLLKQLMSDSDDIIPLTAFDLVETWGKGRGGLLQQIAELAINRGAPPDLVERAKRAKHRLQELSRG